MPLDEFLALDDPRFLDQPSPIPDELLDYVAALQELAHTAPSPFE